MSDADRSRIGTIGWTDLTVEDADTVRDFYVAVIGWEVQPVEMGDYADYAMVAPDAGTPSGGICHARGINAGLPAQWINYWIVEDLDASLAACRERGGRQLSEVRVIGETDRFCFIEDPAGAVCALYQSGAAAGRG